MRKLLVFLGIIQAGLVWGQKKNGSLPNVIYPSRSTVCYAHSKDEFSYIKAPDSYFKALQNSGARTEATVFDVTYVGFEGNPEAKNAFQKAVDIWSTQISSPTKIKVKAYWRSLAANVLGSAIWGEARANFDNAPKLNTFYPIALAEKIAGKDLNHPDSTDILANFSSNANWYFGTDGATPAQQYDLVTVVLHELGHGLGFVDSYSVEGTTGSVGVRENIPIIYDLPIENGSGQNLFQTFDSPSTDLKTQLTGSNIYFNNPQNSIKPRLYAPSTFSGGSSISHLNETTYPAGDPNSLMSPSIGQAESNHDPGPIMINMFNDMGWVITRLEHTALKDTEDSSGPYPILVHVSSDNGFTGVPKLNYIKKSVGTETSIDMTPTGNANEFTASIPGGTPDTTAYYISISDNLNQKFTNPGKIVKLKSAETQGRFIFGTGPDVTPPKVTHNAIPFVKNTETAMVIQATITDNLGVQDAMVEYLINDVAQPTVTLPVKDADKFLYESTITLPNNLVQGDKIKYRIVATDIATAHNVQNLPTSSTYFEVNVVSLGVTKDVYQNNFDDLVTSDFFGNFEIKTPTGFQNGAIHTIHPYVEAGNGNSINYTYQLRYPIKLKSADAIIKFDEIVLVEPGETGAAFGTADFYDYVVTEGSKDGGITWVPFADGYDSRDNAPWLTKYNSQIVNNISLGVGDPTMYRNRTINMLNKFAAGDEVVIRFRLYSDPGAAGWGWAIDNLKIQIDDTPPTILHNHTDFIASNAPNFDIATKVTDGSGLKDLSIEVGVNGGTPTSNPFTISPSTDEYILSLNLTSSALKAGDEIQYRIISTDNANNQAVLPATGFFKVAILDFSGKVDSYVSDFNASNSDFVGNFFSISTPTGFSNGAIHSSNPYPVGFGYSQTSDLSFVLKKPVTVSATNHMMLFDEILLAEYAGFAVKDYAIIEGSKDNGVTWKAISDQYSSNSISEWRNAYDSKGTVNSSLYKSRLLDITKSGNFKAGDIILIRFRLFTDKAQTGWGWAIDNLSIQGPVTGIDKKEQELELSLYPNPAKEGSLSIQLTNVPGDAYIQIMDIRGGSMAAQTLASQNGEIHQTYSIDGWSAGLYLVKVQAGSQTLVKKFLKSE